MDAGSKIVRGLEAMLARKDVNVRTAMLGPETAHRWQAVKAFMDEGERVHAPYAQGVIDMLGGVDAFPPEMHDLLVAAGAPTQAFEWLLELVVLAIGIFSAAGALVGPPMQDLVNKAWEQNLDMPVTVQDLALAELRGFLAHDHALALARETGFSPDKYDIIYNDTGEPPSIQELLYLRRRGHIDDSALDHGIRQSRVRDEWIPAIHNLMYVPPSAGEAVSAAVQNHLSADDARAVVAANGIDPAAYDWLYATAGRPPGIQELLELLNRGEVDEATVTQAVRESDVKDKYIPAILAMRRHLMPERTVVSAISKGVFTRDEGIAHLHLLGFNDADAQALASEASATKSAAHRERTEAQVLAGYRDGVLDRPGAHDWLVRLNYDAGEADYLLDLADAERNQALQRQVIATTRAKYVAHHLDDSAASGALDSAHVPAATRDQLIAQWAIERGENARMLTPAVLVKGVKGDVVSWADFLAYMDRLGYSTADAALYGQIEGIAPAGA